MPHTTVLLIQKFPCPHCGRKEGWWSPIKAGSAVYHTADGTQKIERVKEAENRFCTGCNNMINQCVTSV